MSRSLTLTAPAKINLSLRILGKREDGYHEIETVMSPVSLADEIELRRASGEESEPISFLCSDPTLPLDENNLCVKAAQAFQKATENSESISITLHKKIPHGAGLGGGSSDAAAVLRGMNMLFGKPLRVEELHQLAATLGSDVAFFLDAKPRCCRGRGELLGETLSLPDWKLLLIKPPFSIASAEAYKMLEAGSPPSQEQGLQVAGGRRQTERTLLNDIRIFNDLEIPVFEKYLQLPILKSWLQARAEVATAWMTGSGSTMVTALKKNISVEKVATLQKSIITEFGNSFWIQGAVPVQ